MVNYLLAGIIKFHWPKRAPNIKKDYSLQPTVSILLPCFNEGAAVYDTIKSLKRSRYPEDKLEIIVTDDCSVDDSWDHILRAKEDFGHVTAIRNEQNLGKTKTILNAMNASQADIVMVVDSDTVLHPNCIREVMSCFAEPNMGVVGVPASVKNPNDNALTAYQTSVYFSGFRVYRAPHAAVKQVGCIGGYALAIRRHIFQSIQEELEARRFLGCIVNDGEDRMITHLVLLQGWDTYQDSEAKCWTGVPNKYDKYWAQQIRWRRTFVRDFIWTIKTLPRHHGLHPSLLIQYVLIPLSILISGVNALVLLAGGTAWFDSYHMFLFCVVAFLSLTLARMFHPGDQDLKHPWKVLMFAPFWLINTLMLTVIAATTLDSGDWGNRTKKG